MEDLWVYAMVTTLLMFLWLFILLKQNHKNLPPSPPSLPIIGHLHLLNKNKPLHRALHDLSIKYGPICYIKIGRVPMLVISSPALVEECLVRNDVVLANRPRNRNTLLFHYNSTTLGTAPYGPLWRDLRRITALELFSTTRLNLLTDVREDETKSLVKGLFKNLGSSDGTKFIKVKVRSKLFECSFNIIMRMLTGKRYVFGVNDEKGASEGADNVLYAIITEFFEQSSALNPIDSFPFLRWINYGNIEGKMKDVRNKFDAFLDDVLEECRNLRANGSSCTAGEKIPMIYKLFDLQELHPKEYTDQILKGIIMVMLIAGIDTSVVTIEWALALLLDNKRILDKAQLQVDSVLKGSNRVVDESDLDKLQLMQNIVDETLRLFPSGPLLIPHLSSEDCNIGGYNVPKGTMVHISAWAVQRDPNVWDDPLTFKPERFEGISKVNDLRSSFIPFGLGRRSCPGASLGNRVTTLILSSLLQCFDWKKVDGVNIDFTEGSGLTMPMATPLIAMCKARPSMVNVLSTL